MYRLSALGSLSRHPSEALALKALKASRMASDSETRVHQVLRALGEALARMIGKDTGSIYNLQSQLSSLKATCTLDSKEMRQFISSVESSVRSVQKQASSKEVAQVMKYLLKQNPQQWGRLFREIDTKYKIGFLDNHGRQLALIGSALMVTLVGIASAQALLFQGGGNV